MNFDKKEIRILLPVKAKLIDSLYVAVIVSQVAEVFSEQVLFLLYVMA